MGLVSPVFSYSIFWRDLIHGILPSASTGIIVVVSDPGGSSFSYRLDGSHGSGQAKETYLGPGDWHDHKYDELGQSWTLNELMETTTEESTYTGIPLSETYCVKTIHVYPSQDMENVYVTREPKIFAALVPLIFVLTSVVFLVYDKYVARRQAIIRDRAMASGK